MQTIYKLTKPEKYIGNTDLIYYRSSWEKAFLVFLEESPVISKFSSEEVVVSYFYLLDHKWHKYYIDFYIQLITGHKYLIEIKPFSQRLNPTQKSNQYNKEVFIKNQCKWEYAVKFAKNNGMEFLILDEYDLKRIGVRIPIVPIKSVITKKLLFEKSNKYGQSVEILTKSLLHKK